VGGIPPTPPSKLLLCVRAQCFSRGALTFGTSACRQTTRQRLRAKTLIACGLSNALGLTPSNENLDSLRAIKGPRAHALGHKKNNDYTEGGFDERNTLKKVINRNFLQIVKIYYNKFN